MTLAVGSVPTAQLPAVPSSHPKRPPIPPARKFHRSRLPSHPYTLPPMEAAPTSPPLSHLPSSSEVFPNSSPSPPPPPPSYTISDLPTADLPPPPPLTLWQEMASPCYMCCYDPPSPEVKSEYDPKLPLGFFSTPDIFPSSPPPPVHPPPPRPSPPPPPTPPVRHISEDLPPSYNAATSCNTMAFHSESAMESGECEDHSVETCSTSSLVSSSTLTAADFQAQDSDSSPLPPHELRVSPLSTDAVTLSSQVSINSITPSSDVSLTPNFLSANHEYTFCSNTSELLSQASVLMNTFYDASYSAGPPLPSLLDLKPDQQEPSTLTPGSYTRMESIKSEDGSYIPSEVSCTTTDTAGLAVMESPLSTDLPSIPSLPTDLNSVSSGFGSLSTDTWSFSTEIDSQPEDSSERTKSCVSSATDRAFTTTGSDAVSPAFTTSSSITPMPADYLTPLFSSPALTPVQSPQPSSPCPYLYKSESPLNSGSATPQGIDPSQWLQTATSNGECSSPSSVAPVVQMNSFPEHNSFYHSFSPSHSHFSDLYASQLPSSQVTEQYMNYTKENSISVDILSKLTQLDSYNYSSLERINEENTEYLEVSHSTASQENGNGQISDQITLEKEEVKESSTDEKENRKTSDEQKQGEKDSVVESCKEKENHNGRDDDGMVCRENDDNHVVKDVNGNINFLDLEDVHEEQLEKGQDVSESRHEVEDVRTQTMKICLFQSLEEILERKTGGQDNIHNVQPSHSTPVPSPSFYDSSSVYNIHSGDTVHLSSNNDSNVISYNERGTISPPSGTSSIFTHCSPAAESCRVEVSTTPKGAMDLLDAMVTDLENISADLPTSPILRPLDPSPQTALVPVLSKDEQPVTQISEISKIPDPGSYQNGDPEELKVENCHVSEPSLRHDSLPHPTPISSVLSSHTFPSTSTMPPYHACRSGYFSTQCTCVSSSHPSLTTNRVTSTCSVSPPSWEMPCPDPDPFSSSDDYANTTLLMNDTSESASQEEVLLDSHLTDLEYGTPLPSLCSSPKPSSHLESQPSPSPAPRPRTPPTPPPRSCHNTPRSYMVPPLPPVRQYMLVPINISLGASQPPSPPPAPPRSTSVHRSSPPPPPRPSAPPLPSPAEECSKGPPLPPLPFPSCFSPPQPALTPVPEESSNPQSPVPSESSDFASPLSEDVPFQPILPSVTSQQLPSVPPSLSSCSSEDPPALPPPPQDDQEDEDLPAPPPPPPPIESDEAAPPLPLPPPPSHILFSPSLHYTTPTPGKGELSSPLCPQQEPASPGLCVAASYTNPSSTPSSDPDLPTPTVDDVASLPPTKIPTVTISLQSTMSNSPAVDAATTSSPPLILPPPHAPPPNPPLPPCAPGSNTEAVKSPLITTSPYGKLVVVRSDLPLPSPEEEVRVAFTTSKDYGFLADGEDTLSVYTQLRPVIQQGPQCGLVSLSMASQVFPQTVEVEELLATGRVLDVTRHGEMFSTTALARLAEKTVTGVQAEVRRDVLSSPATLLQLLLQGDLVLVPYDAERNHQPGQMGGHKAHWGVVCGCLVQSSSLTFPTAAAKLDSHVDNLWHLRPRSRAGRSRSVTPCPPTLPGSPKVGQRGLKTLDRTGGCEGNPPSVSCSRVNTPMLFDLQNDDELRLVALWRQGKSRKVMAAPLDQLCESNDQLVSYPAPVTPQEADYVVGSVQEGLAGQVVVLHKTKATLSDLVGLLQEK